MLTEQETAKILEGDGTSMETWSEERFRWEVLRICYRNRKISVSLVQCKIGAGYCSVRDAMQYWEHEKYISPCDEWQKREFLVSKERFAEEYNERMEHGFFA